MLNDRGLLTEQTGALGAELLVPETVQAVIAARLDTLPPERKAVLHDASVLGKVFWAGAVTSIGEHERGTVEVSLRELSRKELVRRSRQSSVANDVEYAFWHALARDVAYGQIPRRVRARKHRAAAEWIAQMAGERVADHAELLAHHYGEALSLARASGEEELARELREPALKFLELAGDHTFQLGGIDAEPYFRRALELVDDPRTRGRLLVKHGRALGRREQADELLAEAIELLRDHGSGTELAEALEVQALALRWRGKTSEARAIFEQALEAALPDGPTPVLSEIYGDLSFNALMQGDDDAALQYAEQALRIAEQLADPRYRYEALEMRALALIEKGELEGIDDLRTARDGQLELGQGAIAAVTWGNLGEVVWLENGPAAGLEEKRQAAEIGLSRGAPSAARWIRAEMTWIQYDAGNWDDVLSLVDEIAAEEARAGTSQASTVAQSHKGRVLAQRGSLAAATAVRDDALPRAREIGDMQVVVPALVTSALVDLYAGRAGEAAAQIEELELLTRGHGFSRAREAAEALRICRRTGALATAEALAAGPEPKLTRDVNARHVARATLLELRGEYATACEQYEESATRWHEYGFPLEEAHALLGAARCLSALERADDAAVRATSAREIFSSLDARFLVAEADALVPGMQAASA
jgi:tetratricopeptide (TPR) repeat protein